MIKISLPLALTLVSGLSVAFLTVILIPVGLSLTSRFAQNVGQEHARRIGEIAAIRTETLFELPAKIIHAAQRQVQRPGLRIPMDDPSPTWYEAWEPILDFPLLISNYSFLVSYAVLADDSTLRARVYDNKIMNHMFSPSHGPSFLRQIYLSNYSNVARELYYPFPFADVRGSMFPATKAAQNIIGKRKGATFWRSFDAAVFPTQIIKTAFGVLTNNSGAFLGYMCIVSPYDSIDHFLQDAVSDVPGAIAIVVDHSSLVVATSLFESHPARWLVPNITDIYNTSTIVGTNCILPNPHDTTRTGACMKTVTSYNYEPLTKAANMIPSTFPSGGQTVQSMSASGTEYILVVQGLQNSIASSFNLTLYMFYPLEYVLNSVKNTQSLLSFVSGSVAVILAVASASLTFALVVPLKTLHRQIVNAASFSHETQISPRSLVVEIFNLQTAFLQMSQRLTKVKKFLPQPIVGPSSCFDGAESETPFTETQSPPTELILAVLSEEQNTFVRRRSTVVVVECFDVSDSPEVLSKHVQKLAHLLVRETGKYGGVIEQLHPRISIITFNVHNSCDCHEEKATRFAQSVSLSCGHNTILAVDTALHLVGTIGADYMMCRIHTGEGTDVCRKLTALGQFFLRVNVLLTERVVEGLPTMTGIIPIEVVQFHWTSSAETTRRQEVKIFTLFQADGSDAIQAMEVHREAFVQLINGKRSESFDTLCTTPHSIRGITDRMISRLGYLKQQGIPLGRSEAPPWLSRDDFVGFDPSPNTHERDAEGEPASPMFNASLELNDVTVVKQLLARRQKKPSTQGESSVTFDEDALFSFAEVQPTKQAQELPELITDLQGTTWRREGIPIESQPNRKAALFRVLNPNGATCVMKVLPFDDSDPETVADIQSEFEVFFKLRHENIISYLTCAVLESHFLLFMEYAPCGSIGHILDQYGSLDIF